MEQHYMTESKKNDWLDTIDLGDILDTTISLPDDYITDDTVTISLDNMSWDFGNKIDPDEVAKMCKEYPGLEKVWRNFKSVYDMCKQDYKGKLKERGLDDDIPF